MICHPNLSILKDNSVSWCLGYVVQLMWIFLLPSSLLPFSCLPSLRNLSTCLSTTNVHAKHNKRACSEHTRQWCCEGPLYKCPGGASCHHQQPGVGEEVALPWAGAAQMRRKAIDLLQRAPKPLGASWHRSDQNITDLRTR